MASRSVRVREDQVALILSPREAVALRRFCSSPGIQEDEFSGPGEYGAFRRAVSKIWQSCPAAMWTRFDFDWPEDAVDVIETTLERS